VKTFARFCGYVERNSPNVYQTAERQGWGPPITRFVRPQTHEGMRGPPNAAVAAFNKTTEFPYCGALTYAAVNREQLESHDRSASAMPCIRESRTGLYLNQMSPGNRSRDLWEQGACRLGRTDRFNLQGRKISRTM
jgi:hypothetical protein